MYIKLKFTFCFIFLIFFYCSGDEKFPALKGDYLGQKPPGDIPELFAPGIISTGYHESKIIFSPDGNEAYYNMMHLTHRYNAIIFRKKENGKWSLPQVVSFSGKFRDANPFFSSDGNRLYFTSDRPLNSDTGPGNFDIWIAEKLGNGWSEPLNLGEIINTDKTDVDPCVTSNNNLYFSSNRDGGFGLHDIYIARYENGEYKKPENLGDSINSAGFESNPYVSPDESYMILNAFRGDIRGLHISYKREDGTWTKAKNMGDIINEKTPSMMATVSHDGKYLFFTSQKVPYLPYSGNPLNYGEIMEMFNSPQNGTGDIYWVDAKIIEDLKPEELK